MDNNEKLLRQKTDQRREVMQLKQRNSRDCSFQKQYTLKDLFFIYIRHVGRRYSRREI